ncbi:MAG: chemotaxis protein CheA [Geobacter sp.]|nr:chemotaxis protein CheA [Geobacter sp.]
MDTSRYRDLFVSEAQEHLNALGSLALQCEQVGTAAPVHEMFRHAHSLKGMAATMRFTPVSSLAHALEELLVKIRDGKLPADRGTVDLILAAVTALEQSVHLISQGNEPFEHTDLANRICRYVPPEAVTLQHQPSAQTTVSTDHTFRKTDDRATTRIKTELLDRLVTLSGELLTARYMFEEIIQRRQLTELQQPFKELSTLLRLLQNEVVEARMVPFGSIAERFPRMVRDLAHRSGKEVQFRIEGEGIELDRGILQQITEPLMHLLRNAVDHGLETSILRSARGKPAEGTLTLALRRQADRIMLQVSDDGCGMDPDRIRAKAVDQGLVARNRAASLSLEETLLLVCTPGFSTAEQVSDISGRGVGMDVVRSTIQALGGTLTIDSTPAKGTVITLNLPISTAIMHALLVACGNLQIAVPTNAVTGTLEISPEAVSHNDGELKLRHKGNEIPLRSLARLFCQPEPQGQQALLPVILTESNRQPVGLLADRILGQQELFIRPLQPPLSSLRGLSGACLTGSGQIIFMVDPAACAAARW